MTVVSGLRRMPRPVLSAAEVTAETAAATAEVTTCYQAAESEQTLQRKHRRKKTSLLAITIKHADRQQ